MPQSVPTPLAAALGLVPTVLGGVRRLPGKAVQLPVIAIGSALSRMDSARREYLELADRGERLVARLRGTSFDELEDRVEDALQGTPLARPYDAVEDALEDAGEAVVGSVSQLTARVAQSTGRTAQRVERTVDEAAEATADTVSKAADTLEKTADEAGESTGKAGKAAAGVAVKAVDKADKATGKAAKKAEKAAAKTTEKAQQAADEAQSVAGEEGAAAQDELPEAERPKGEPTPAATQPDATRIDTAASADVVETVEQVSARAAAPKVLDHDDLPLADYDHMTLGSLRGRLRSLDLDQLVQVRDYEKAHADRLPIVTMLDNRIAKLAATPAAEQPSGVPSDRPAPGQGDTAAGSVVSPATGGPALNPPSQGVPTNPSQPRTTGSPGTNPSSNA